MVSKYALEHLSNLSADEMKAAIQRLEDEANQVVRSTDGTPIERLAKVQAISSMVAAFNTKEELTETRSYIDSRAETSRAKAETLRAQGMPGASRYDVLENLRADQQVKLDILEAKLDIALSRLSFAYSPENIADLDAARAALELAKAQVDTARELTAAAKAVQAAKVFAKLDPSDTDRIDALSTAQDLLIGVRMKMDALVVKEIKAEAPAHATRGNNGSGASATLRPAGQKPTKNADRGHAISRVVSEVPSPN